jgi:putative transposase
LTGNLWPSSIFAMPRLARVVAAGLPRHVAQRGLRRTRVFGSEGDYAAYVELVADWRAEHGVAVRAWRLIQS